MNFKDKLREKILYYLPDFNPEILEKGLEKLESQQFSAGEYLINAGEITPGVFIAEKSISRACQIKENGEEKTMWIEP
jgi:CRP-like cAMP-binding protein